MREMKDSGTYWLGYVPSNWNISKINTVYKLRNIKVSDREYHPLSVTMKGIVPQQTLTTIESSSKKVILQLIAAPTGVVLAEYLTMMGLYHL